MFLRTKKEVSLPGWLWFFLILPIALSILLLYRQKRLPQLRGNFRRRLTSLPRPSNHFKRYTEPDSIPLEIRTGEQIRLETTVKDDIGADLQNEAMVMTRVDRQDTTESKETLESETDGSTGLDDLKMIEGIGPSISRFLNEAGIMTFRQLEKTPISRLEEILIDAHLRHLADPTTWPEQAHLAAEGDWEGLKRLQETLKGGRRRKKLET
jgi:predicted flap endonuclease-1-like 5' DNA nuclease